MTRTLKFAALGIDHRHVFGMAEHLLREGCTFERWWTEGMPNTLDGFSKRFSDVDRAESVDQIIEDEAIELVLIAAVPEDRADLAIRAMQAGKDVMVDKPGCTTLEQLERIRTCVAETGRIWSVNFSERFEVACVTKASELVAAGAIGDVVQTVGLGPHRLNRDTRPDWFFKRRRYGGILADIGSHQIDQFLHFTGSRSADVTMAMARNYANHDDPELQDFGEMHLKTDHASGYIRVDWYTPDALPNWGDGRLTILGTEGYIDLRKYVDVGRSSAIDQLFLVNKTRFEQIDASDAGYPYFQRLINDIEARSETAMSQEHCFKVMELALQAQALAEQSDGAV